MTKNKIINIIREMDSEDFSDFSEEFEEYLKTLDYHKQYLELRRIYDSEPTVENLYNLINVALKRDKCIIKELRLNDYDVWCSYDKYTDYKSLSFSASTFSNFLSKHY